MKKLTQVKIEIVQIVEAYHSERNEESFYNANFQILYRFIPYGNQTRSIYEWRKLTEDFPRIFYSGT